MKNIMIYTKGLTKLEWLKLRRKGIGGSDASVVMGKNPWKSVLQLWEDKTGMTPIEEEGNEYTYWGSLMENVIRKEFIDRSGLKVRQKHYMIFHPDYSFMFADVDGIVTDENGKKCIFEAKTVSQYRQDEWKDGHVPQEYMLQVQHYLAVCGLEKAYIAALIGGNHFVYYVIERDEGIIEKLLEAEKYFWIHNVQGNIPPEVDDSKATGDFLSRKYEKSVKQTVRLNGAMESVLAEYKKVDSQMKDMEKVKTGLSNQIKAALGEYEEGRLDNGQVVKWKRIEKQIIDTKRLRAEKPEIYGEYSNITSYRTLSVAS